MGSEEVEVGEIGGKLEETYPQRRKLCTGPDHAGPRWLWWGEFHVARKDHRGLPVVLTSSCRACRRLALRKRRRGGGEGISQDQYVRGMKLAAELDRQIYGEQRKREKRERRRKYEREWWRLRDGGERRRTRRDGAGRYKTKHGHGQRVGSQLDAEPFLDWWSDREISDIGQGPYENVRHQIRESRGTGKIPLWVVDEVCVAYGDPGLLTILYPEEE